jgi:hypothetical protein
MATRSAEAGHQSSVDGVIPYLEHDWDRRRRGFSSACCNDAAGYGDHSQRTADQIGYERRQLIVLTL